jgi:hypothetical protein
MKLDLVILLVFWIISIGLIFIIPAAKRRLAIIAFLFKQMVTWLLGLVVVEAGWLSYPVRFFASVNRTSFCYEYFFYPIICAIFNVYYPVNRSNLVKILYYSTFCTALTIPEILLEKYTELISYHGWTWYWTWISLYITFAMTRSFCEWYFRKLSTYYQSTL